MKRDDRTWLTLALIGVSVVAIGCGDTISEADDVADDDSVSSSSSGQGGSSGSSGTSSSSSGSSGSSSGSTSSSSGSTSSSSSSGSSSGSTSSSSSSGSSGTECAVISAENFQLLDIGSNAVVFGSETTGAVADTDLTTLELYGDGSTPAAGVFDLQSGLDANYATCTHCVRALVGDPQAPSLFFQSAGELVVDAGRDPFSGSISARLRNVTLVEVTIAPPPSYQSTPVPNGRCFALSETLVLVGAPGEWTCDPSTYAADDGCDCACGVVDPDCGAAPDVTACDYCDACGAPAQCVDRVDPAHVERCLAVDTPDEWVCDPFVYGADDVCDCGCGAPDPDCADATAASCDSCSECGEARCDVIVNATNNALCQPPPPPPDEWTCNDLYYGDGDCDCACGALDIDCPVGATPAACEYCTACPKPNGQTCADVVATNLYSCRP